MNKIRIRPLKRLGYRVICRRFYKGGNYAVLRGVVV